jgi:Methyl-accepting chemotaxis protein
MGLFVALLSATSGAIGFYFLNEVTHEYGIIAEDNVPSLNELAALRATIRELRIEVRSIGLAGNTQADVNQYIEKSKEQVALFEKHLEAYEKIDSKTVDRKSYREILAGWKEFKTFGVEVLTLSQDYKMNEEKIVHLIRDICSDKAHKVYAPLLEETKYQMDFSDMSAHAAQSAEARAKAWVSIFAVVSILLAGAVSFFSSTVISRTVKQICDALAHNSLEVSRASSSLADASTTMNDGSNKAASMLESSTASISQIESIVKLSNDRAHEAKKASEASKNSAEAGSGAVKQLMTSMSQINNSSKKMQDIITIIEDISFQTNLLALNAAVEAARAGEAGRGFAVVAEAVRSLAQRSSISAKEISELIVESASHIKEGVKKAEQSQDVLHQILKSVEQVSAINEDIATSSQEQQVGIHQVSSALVNLDSTSQSNTEASQQVSSIARELGEKTEAVDSLISSLRGLIEGEKAA